MLHRDLPLSKTATQERLPLPPELLVHILSFLNNRDLKRSAAVNKTWHIYINETLIPERAKSYLYHKTNKAGLSDEQRKDLAMRLDWQEMAERVYAMFHCPSRKLSFYAGLYKRRTYERAALSMAGHPDSRLSQLIQPASLSVLFSLIFILGSLVVSSKATDFLKKKKFVFFRYKESENIINSVFLLAGYGLLFAMHLGCVLYREIEISSKKQSQKNKQALMKIISEPKDEREPSLLPLDLSHYQTL